MEWRKNTDEDGKIYGRISIRGAYVEVTLYKDPGCGALVASGKAELPADGLAFPVAIQLEAKNESALYGRVVIKRDAQDQDFELAVVPELLIWQLQAQIGQWEKEDHPKPVHGANLPIVDPDMLVEDHFCRALDTNDAWKLWKEREAVLTEKRKELKGPEDRPSTCQEMFDKVWTAAHEPPKWDVIGGNLKSEDEQTVQDAIKELQETWHLSVETFAFLNELRKRDSVPRRAGTEPDPETKAREKAERDQAIDILVNVQKRRDLYARWAQEEQGRAIELTPRYFCLPSEQPEPPHSLGVREDQLSSWNSELERNSQAPIVDPDVLHVLPSVGFFESAGERWRRKRRRHLARIERALPVGQAAGFFENWFGSVVNRRPAKCAPFRDRLGVKPVVVVGQSNLGYVQGTFRAPLADIDPHVHRSHESFDPAGRFPGQTVFQSGEHVATGIFQI